MIGPLYRGNAMAQAMIDITRINHTAITTPRDVEAMHTFYCQHLGAERIKRDIPAEYEALIPGFWLQFDNGQVHVIQQPTPGEPGDPTGPHIAFYVRCLASAEQYLRAHSIRYQRIQDFIILSDPAGNTIELQQDPELADR